MAIFRKIAPPPQWGCQGQPNCCSQDTMACALASPSLKRRLVVWKMYCGMWCRVYWYKFIYVLEEVSASIFKVKRKPIMQSKAQCVFCEARTELLCIIWMKSNTALQTLSSKFWSYTLHLPPDYFISNTFSLLQKMRFHHRPGIYNVFQISEYWQPSCYNMHLNISILVF
jgi:hypothetical protein